MWRRVTSILSSDGAELRVFVFFFKSMVQLILIFGAEILVVTPRMGRFLGGVPGLSGTAINRDTPAASVRREVRVHLGDNVKGGGGFLDDMGVHLAKASPSAPRVSSLSLHIGTEATT